LAERLQDVKEAFRRCAQTPTDQQAFDTERDQILAMAEIEDQRLWSEVKAKATRREIVGFGRTHPEAAESPIDPRYWDFLDEIEDAVRNALSGPGLYFAAVRFANWDDLSPAWRAYVEYPQSASPAPGLTERRRKEPAYRIMRAKKFELVNAGKIHRGMIESEQFNSVLKHLGIKGDKRGFTIDNFAKYVADEWPSD
jgi:hypothetical protein